MHASGCPQQVKTHTIPAIPAASCHAVRARRLVVPFKARGEAGALATRRGLQEAMLQEAMLEGQEAEGGSNICSVLYTVNSHLGAQGRKP